MAVDLFRTHFPGPYVFPNTLCVGRSNNWSRQFIHQTFTSYSMMGDSKSAEFTLKIAPINTYTNICFNADVLFITEIIYFFENKTLFWLTLNLLQGVHLINYSPMFCKL